MKLRHHVWERTAKLHTERFQISVNKGWQGKAYDTDLDAQLVRSGCGIVKTDNSAMFLRLIVAKEIVLPLALLPLLREDEPIEFGGQIIEHRPGCKRCVDLLCKLLSHFPYLPVRPRFVMGIPFAQSGQLSGV